MKNSWWRKTFKPMLGAMLIGLLTVILFGKTYDSYALDTSNTPKSTWTTEEWNGYKERLNTALPSGKYAMYISIDGQPMTSGYKVYQGKSAYTHDLTDTGYVTLTDTLANFPGVYLLNASILSEKNYVRVYKASETDGYKYEASEWCNAEFFQVTI